MSHDVEYINKLFLELSQFATATTAKELALYNESCNKSMEIMALHREISILKRKLKHCGVDSSIG